MQEFVQSFEKLKHPVSLPESEESWDQIYKGYQQLGRLCQSGVFEQPAGVISSFRSIHRNLISAINSERTRLSGAALDVLSTLAEGLGTDFAPLLSLFLPSILLLCGRTNKTTISRAKGCVLAIIETTQLPGILNYLAQSSKDKSPTIRLAAAEGTLSCLKCFNPPDIEQENLSSCIEGLIRTFVRDANADIRKVGKEIFWNYKVLLPDRIARYLSSACPWPYNSSFPSFAAPLTPMTRKHLQLTASNIPSHGNRPTSMIARPASRTMIETSNAQLIRNRSVARPPKNAFNITEPPALSQPSKSSRATQILAKRTANASSASSIEQKAHRAVSHPYAQHKNATGPQRVIRSDTKPAAATSVPSMTQTDMKTSTTRLADASCLRVVSSNSLMHTSGSQPAAPSKKQMPIILKEPENMKPSGDVLASTAASRNLSRPTISQLARVRPPVIKTMPKAIPKLETRKTKLLAKSESNGPTVTQGLNNKGRSANIAVEPLKDQQPVVPASISLPLSPDSSTLTQSPVTSNVTTPERSKTESSESRVAATNRQAPSQVELGAEGSSKQIPFRVYLAI